MLDIKLKNKETRYHFVYVLMPADTGKKKMQAYETSK